MVNRGLRQMDVDIIIKMGFFIKDLHQHIEQLHGQESNQQFVVYRGQGMSKIDCELLIKTKGGLIAFNNFLSTSKDRSVSLRFANHALRNADLVGVVFIMTVDSSQSTTPFASIKDVSAIQSEDEVLFAMQTVFRIGNITSMDENARLFQVELSLTDDNDKDLRQLTAYIRKETWPDSEGWYRLGEVFRRMGRYDKSEEVYRILLEQTTNESEKAPIYNQLGLAKRSQGQYKEAIIFIEKDIDISRKTLPPNHPNLAKSYNNVGLVYDEMGEYTKALSYFEKAVEIQQLSLPPDHPNLAFSYNNIGMVYKSLGEYPKALSYYEKSLEILQQILPLNHPDLALSYNNIGLIYNSMGEYPKALSFLEKALEIQKQSLRPNHSDSSTSYNNIGTVYENVGEYSKALSYHEKALEIQAQALPPNHPDLAGSYGNIGLLYENMGNYSKAHSSFERAFQIVQQLTPATDLVVKLHQNDLERIKKKLYF